MATQIAGPVPPARGGRRTRWARRISLTAALAAVGLAALGWAVGKLLDSASRGVTAVVASGSPPLTVAVSFGPVTLNPPQDDWLPQSFVFPQPFGEIPQPPADLDTKTSRSAWAYSLGAVDAELSEVQLLVQGTDAKAVVLQDMHVRVVERRAPLSGTYVESPGGDALPFRTAWVDLDQEPPGIRLDESTDTGGQWNFPLRVSESEPEVLLLFAEAQSCDCSWVVELSYTQNGEHESLVIDNNGKPFRTTGIGNVASEDHYVLSPGEGIVPAETFYQY